MTNQKELTANSLIEKSNKRSTTLKVNGVYEFSDIGVITYDNNGLSVNCANIKRAIGFGSNCEFTGKIYGYIFFTTSLSMDRKAKAYYSKIAFNNAIKRIFSKAKKSHSFRIS